MTRAQTGEVISTAKVDLRYSLSLVSSLSCGPCLPFLPTTATEELLTRHLGSLASSFCWHTDPQRLHGPRLPFLCRHHQDHTRQQLAFGLPFGLSVTRVGSAAQTSSIQAFSQFAADIGPETQVITLSTTILCPVPVSTHSFAVGMS